jgi:hypothetical protein
MGPSERAIDYTLPVLRRCKVQIVVTPALRAFAAWVAECDLGGWPAGWELLRERALATVELVRKETDELRALLARVDAGRGVVTLFADDRDGLLGRVGALTVAVDLDLAALLSDDAHGPDAIRALTALLERVARSDHHALGLRMGGREAAYDDVLDTLVEQARSRGILLARPAESDRERGVPTPWEASERIDPREVFGSGEPHEGSWETLDDDERAFLDEAGVRWPLRRNELDECWRTVAFAAHPDRRPDDPSAVRRFVRLKAGYEGLRSRIS